MRIAFYEDQAAARFSPVALMRPVFELLCGRFSLRQRLVRWLDVSEWGAFLRPYLADQYREQHPEARINDFTWLGQQPTLLINGRWLPSPEALSNIQGNEAGVIDGTVVYLVLDPDEGPLLSLEDWDEPLARIARTRRVVPASGSLLHYPWDLVGHNGEQLRADGQAFASKESRPPQNGKIEVLGDPNQVALDPTAQIDPFVVLDARGGPISIGPGAVIHSFTKLEGPCHIGREAQLFRALIREETTIGPVCRVGGEVEASILHGHVNKYHEGFLGHSYVCPWVNLGALTTNSDLKNDYSQVRVPLAGEPIETGTTKVGCFIGDHTKTALGSLFNTGSSIGVMSLVLPGGELLPKHIPSFSRIWHGWLRGSWPLERYLETARHVMARRNQVLTAGQLRALRFLYEHSRPERQAAIERFQQKQYQRQASITVEDG